MNLDYEPTDETVKQRRRQRQQTKSFVYTTIAICAVSIYANYFLILWLRNRRTEVILTLAVNYTRTPRPPL